MVVRKVWTSLAKIIRTHTEGGIGFKGQARVIVEAATTALVEAIAGMMFFTTPCAIYQRFPPQLEEQTKKNLKLKLRDLLENGHAYYA